MTKGSPLAMFLVYTLEFTIGAIPLALIAIAFYVNF